jgi:hypothetical protein
MFRNPGQFGIEIIQTSTYEEVLIKDLEIFRMKKNTSAFVNMMKVFQYKEINGRSLEQVQEDMEKKFSIMEKIHSDHLTQKIKNYMSKGYLSMKDISFLLEKK